MRWSMHWKTLTRSARTASGARTFVVEAQRRVAALELPAGTWLMWGGQYENLVAARERLSLVVPVCFALIFVLGIFITSGYLLQSVNEEKENRVVEIVLSSVPPLPLMAGKVLSLGAAGLTQVRIRMSPN